MAADVPQAPAPAQPAPDRVDAPVTASGSLRLDYHAGEENECVFFHGILRLSWETACNLAVICAWRDEQVIITADRPALSRRWR